MYPTAFILMQGLMALWRKKKNKSLGSGMLLSGSTLMKLRLLNTKLIPALLALHLLFSMTQLNGLLVSSL